ncbi:hypothetical protein ACQ4PT_027622 [Festuca glaucescens]
MTCLAASAATPPAARPASLRLFVAVAAPSPWRSVQPLRALWRREGAGPRAVTMLPRCSSAGDSRAAGDGSLSSFCIIEGPETIQDFVQMQSQEIQDNIKSRRNKIFLLMEEVRRLRVQQRMRAAESRSASTEENEMPEMPSTIPFLPYTVTPSPYVVYLQKCFMSNIHSFCFV